MYIKRQKIGTQRSVPLFYVGGIPELRTLPRKTKQKTTTPPLSKEKNTRYLSTHTSLTIGSSLHDG
jgi:hypothetical protein